LKPHKDYDLERIARLLTEGSDCDALRDFCSFTSGFENLSDKLPKGDRKKPEIVRRIIEFARMKGRIEDVLAWAKRNNPRLYEELEPYQRDAPASEAIAQAAVSGGPAANGTRSTPERLLTEYDVFVSHASEDKQGFVAPLAERLREHGVKVWYDKFTLEWGDSLSGSIAEGLAHSRYGIVVLSKSFFKKSYTKHELQGLWNREIGGRKVILPIWYGVTEDEVKSFDPTLADKLAIDVSKYKDLDGIVRDIIKVVRPDIYRDLVRIG